MQDIEIARAEIYELVKKHGEPKIGRWVWCKYCCKNVRPEVDYLEQLVKCSECDYGLAPLDEVIKAGSYKKWYNKICLDFERFNRYLDEVRKGLREPTGEDEYGIVPYICEKCKKEQATVYGISKGKKLQLCKTCEAEEDLKETLK